MPRGGTERSVREERKSILREKLSKTPEKPGVYLLEDASGKVLYVGKAGNLKNRLTSHVLRGSNEQPRLAALYDKVCEFDYIVTDSEMEALILEANLIKLHMPRYNVRLKDDKKYPYIKVTVNEEYPRAFPTRDLSRDGSVLFGPYTNAKSMRKALDAVIRIFPLRTCKGRLPDSVCLDYQIRRCYGPCEQRISKGDYRHMVDQVTRFLAGKDELVEKELERRMTLASRAMDFETAARLRDQLVAVRETIRRQRVVFRDRVDRDVVGLSRHRNSASVVLLQIRDGKLISSENYMLDALAKAEDSELVRTFLGQYYKNSFFVPKEIILRKSFDDVGLFEAWMSRRKGRKVKILVPRKGDKVRILELAELNARYELAKRISDGAGRAVPSSVIELSHALGLKSPPRRIEAYDISNTGGKESVGSLVVFEDGRARKDGYRRFKIRTVEGQDDFAMMGEVVSRRSKRLKEEGKPPPDLVLIDGGAGQLSSARRALSAYFPGIPIFGLAKRMDELHLPDGRRLMLPRGSAALHLLQRIRDEAHRFAVTYHRKLRGKKMSESVLDGIRGLGEKRKAELLRYFGSLGRLKSATVEEIARVRLLGTNSALRIYEALHR
jgi:excinuclease ABC subunit C